MYNKIDIYCWPAFIYFVRQFRQFQITIMSLITRSIAIIGHYHVGSAYALHIRATNHSTVLPPKEDR